MQANHESEGAKKYDHFPGVRDMIAFSCEWFGVAQRGKGPLQGTFPSADAGFRWRPHGGKNHLLLPPRRIKDPRVALSMW